MESGYAESVQLAIFLVGWVAAFMLGKELQSGFTQWQAGRRDR